MKYYINIYDDGLKSYYTDMWVAAHAAKSFESENGDYHTYNRTDVQVNGVVVKSDIFREEEDERAN